MKKILLLFFLISTTPFVKAQQWDGSSGTSGLINRTGNIQAGYLLMGKYGNSLSGDADPYQISSPANDGTHDLIVYGSNSSTLNLRLYDGSFKLGSSSIPNIELYNSGGGIFSQNLQMNQLIIGRYGNSLAGDTDPYQIASVADDGTHDLIIYGNNATSTLNLRLLDGSFKLGSSASPNATINNDGSGFFNGNIGIGTPNPQQKLHIEKNGNTFIHLKNTAPNGSTVNFGPVSSNGIKETQLQFENELGFYDHANASWRFNIKGNGNVGIGTYNPDSKLTVAGNIHSREVKVTVNAGADFVFDESYELRTLEEIEKFISENKHLPEIASENEMLENGLQVGEMNIKLLQKIEELTLYLIQQNNENQEQQKLIEELQKEVSALKNE